MIRALLVAIALVVALPAAALSTHIEDNVVEVHNSTNGTHSYDSSVAVALASKHSTVDTENRATSINSGCDLGCRSAAVAMQAVIVSTNTNQVVARNFAHQENVSCNSCDGFAGAYQFIVTADGNVKIPRRVENQLQAIRDQIDAVLAADLGALATKPQIDALYADFKAVIVDHLKDRAIGIVDRDTSKAIRTATG